MVLTQWVMQLLILAFPALGAGVLHMAVVKWDIAPWLKKPLDGGRYWRGKRVFGDNKTYRGVIAMAVLSTLFCYVLLALTRQYPSWHSYNLLEFHRYMPWFYGIIYGVAYTLAELPNSFLKRRYGIRPGSQGSWMNVLLDHCDSTVGCLLALYPFVTVTFEFLVLGVVFLSMVHIAADYMLFCLKLRKNPL